MANRGYVANLKAFALTTTPKTAIYLVASATDPMTIPEFSVSADSAVSVLVEICESTAAGAGTAGTAPTVKQVTGFAGTDSLTPSTTVTGSYSVEPTVLTLLKPWIFTGPGPFVIQFPLGREVESLVSGATKYKALALRLSTLSGTTNFYGYVHFEE